MAEAGNPKLAKKQAYNDRLIAAFKKYSRVMFASADNVGSSQMQSIRKELRGKAEIIMGKNTMMRRALRQIIGEYPKLEKMMPYLVGNVGLVFTDEDPADVREIINNNRVGAPAKSGSIAPVDVIVPAGPTGMEPNQTSFFQALNIASKISRGQIEIISDVHLISFGDKVNASQAALLKRLNINPFSYGLDVQTVYDDGTIFSARVLDLTADDIVDRFVTTSNDICKISLAIGYPTVVSVPHSVINAFKNIFAISIGSDYTIKEAEAMKELLDNPEALAALAAAATTSSGGGGGGDAPADDGSESSSSEMGMGLFD